MMVALLAFVTLSLLGMSCIAMVNLFTFPRLGRASRSDAQPLVSILIPARNEAAVIGQTIRSLITQTYLNFEIIVLDDHSSDGTADISRQAGGSSPRLRVVSGAPLPPGWLGKNWACHQLAQEAQGEWLIFTDADVCWAPHALAALVNQLNYSQADMLTVWPTQQTRTWAERLTVPLMALVVLAYLPLLLVHHTRWPIFAAANGQCLAFSRRAYQKINGHAAVKNEVLEDVALSRRAKAGGLRLRMADGAELITCRMYRGWQQVRDGYAKNILAGYGGRVSLLLLATIFHWLVFVMPWLWLVAGWLSFTIPGWPLWPALLIGLGVGLRALTAAATHQRPGDALLLPLSVAVMTRIAAQAIWWQWRYGGPQWKGRLIKPGHTLA